VEDDARTYGTGITKRPLSSIDANDPDILDKTLNGIKYFYEEIEKNNGWFGMVSAGYIQICQQIIESRENIPAEQDSPIDFADRITAYFEAAKAEISRGDADRAARFAFELGLECMRAEMKWRFEPTMLKELRRLDGYKRSTAIAENKIKNEKNRTAIKNEFEELLMSGLKSSEAIGKLAQKYELPKGTIDRRLRRAGALPIKFGQP
jgi:hypothetical protein